MPTEDRIALTRLRALLIMSPQPEPLGNIITTFMISHQLHATTVDFINASVLKYETSRPSWRKKMVAYDIEQYVATA